MIAGAATGDDAVSRLDVAVKYAALVQGSERVEELEHKVDGSWPWERSGEDEVAERGALDAWKDQEGVALAGVGEVLGEVEDREQVRVIEAGAEEGLLADPAALLGGAGVLGVDDLDGDTMTAEVVVERGVDGGGRAGAEDVAEVVATGEEEAAEVGAEEDTRGRGHRGAPVCFDEKYQCILQR